MNKDDLSRVTMRMAIAFGCLFLINSLCLSILGAFTGSKWSLMDTQEKILICVAICGNWTNVLMAYLSKTVARLQSGKPPITGDTDIIRKDQINAS